LTVVDAEGRVAQFSDEVTVAAPSLNVTVDYLHVGDTLTLGEPTDIVVKVAAEGGVGALTNLEFDEDVLESTPTAAIEIVAGPEPAPEAQFSLQADESRTFVVTVVPLLPVRITLHSEVVGFDGAGAPVADGGELV